MKKQARTLLLAAMTSLALVSTGCRSTSTPSTVPWP